MIASSQLFILILPSLVFLYGLMSLVLWRKNFILILLSLEIMFMASNIGFVLWSLYIDDIFGLIFCMSSLAITGAEVALGLALAILLYRKGNHIETSRLKSLRS